MISGRTTPRSSDQYEVVADLTKRFRISMEPILKGSKRTDIDESVEMLRAVL